MCPWWVRQWANVLLDTSFHICVLESLGQISKKRSQHFPIIRDFDAIIALVTKGCYGMYARSHTH